MILIICLFFFLSELFLDIIKDPNREILHDLHTIYLYEKVYNKPFQLSKDIEENMQSIQEELDAIRKESFWQGIDTASQVSRLL